MSGHGEAGSLQRAHALSAQAAELLHSPSPPLPALTSALDAYRQAAELFSQATTVPGVDSGTLKTLQLLTTQHRKLVKDLERRIASAQPILRRAATVPAPSSSGATGSSAAPGRVGRDARPSEPIRRPTEPAGLAAIGLTPSPFFASTASAHRPSLTQAVGNSTRALPPFAQRPHPATTSTPAAPSLTSTSVHQPTLSPLYSSASSEDPDPAESYITFGLGLAGDGKAGRGGKEVDPFSKFWGMLEECLDVVSRPVAFASVPLGPKSEAMGQGEDGDFDEGRKEREKLKRERKRTKSKAKGMEIDRTASPSDSYCMVSSEAPAASSSRTGRTGSPSSKTPEELQLENESLRASLDALAVHNQQVERENQELKKRSLEREAVLRTIAEGVRKEAEKARLDTSVLLRSQILSASISTDAAAPPARHTHVGTSTTTKQGDDAQTVEKLKHRIGALEEEVKSLKTDNEKQKANVIKYKDRLELIKSKSRAKKEARGES